MTEVATTRRAGPGTITAARVLMYLQGAAMAIFGVMMIVMSSQLAERMADSARTAGRAPRPGMFVIFGCVVLVLAALFFVFGTQLRRLRTRLPATALEVVLLLPTVIGLLVRGRVPLSVPGLALPLVAAAVLVLLYAPATNREF